jgi:glucan phosphoethanolaminetransferase (alkaline phosphatase superfamily)
MPLSTARIREQLLRSNLIFDLVFWTPFWLLPLAASGTHPPLALAKDAVVGIAFSAVWAALADLAGARRRYFYLCMGLALWLGAVAFIVYIVSTHAQISAYGLFDAFMFMTPDSRMLGWIAGTWATIPWLVGVSLPFALLAGRWRHLSQPANWRLAGALIAVILAPLGLREAACLEIECPDESFGLVARNFIGHYPVFVSYLALEDLRALHATLDAMAARLPKEPPKVVANDHGPLTLIVVVGEALNRNHMGIYGYCRQTTPRLAARADEIYRFTDLVSLIPETAFAVPSALVLKDLGASVIDVLNGGGFSTYWISTQVSISDNFSAIAFWAGRARHTAWLGPPLRVGVLFVSDTLDDKLLAPFTQALRSDEPRKAIFLHMNGAHWTYTDRFPRGYLSRGFLPLPGTRSAAARQIIDDYDRAIYYDDAIFGQILDAAAAQGGDTAVVIFADHGEEVYDQQPWFTHIFPGSTRNMVEAPLLVWLSPSLRAHRPELANALNAATAKRLTISDLPAIITDIAGLSVTGLPSAARPLSPAFRELPRFSAGHNYDADPNLGIVPELPPACGK